MSNNRTYIVILVLFGLISGLGGVLGNVASDVLPQAWEPYLWLAWPLFIISVLAGIGLAIWQNRLDPRTPPATPADEPPELVPPEPPAPSPPPPAPRPAPPRQAADDEHAYDVFLSYSHADKAWVRGELLLSLEAAGLRLCVDYRDFEPGAPGVTEMERAVLTSRKTLLFFTPPPGLAQRMLGGPSSGRHGLLRAYTDGPGTGLRAT